jgi:hypothetical protein
MSTATNRWLHSWRFHALVFALAVGALIAGRAALAEHERRRAEAALAEMTDHYEQEVRVQLEAARAAAPQATDPSPERPPR